MNANVHFLLIPSFPVNPEVGQMIYVERQYNPEANKAVREFALELPDFFLLYLPTFKKSFYPDTSDDVFYREINPNLRNLYCFMDSAMVMKHKGYDIFEPTRQPIEEVYNCGIINYTGVDYNDMPVFAYYTLEGRREKFIKAAITLLPLTFDAINKNITPYPDRQITSIGRVCECIVIGTNDNLYKSKNWHNTFYDYYNHIHELLYVSFDRTTHAHVNQSVKRENFDKDIVNVSVIFEDEAHKHLNDDTGFYRKVKMQRLDFCFYAYFIAQDRYLSIENILQDQAKLVDLYYKLFDVTPNTINTNSIRQSITRIQKTVQDALLPGRENLGNPNAFAPFIVTKEECRWGDDTYGIPLCAKEYPHGKRYLEEFRTKLQTLTGISLKKEIRFPHCD